MTYLQNQTEQLEMASAPSDAWMRLGRFLNIGSEDGTYYVPARPLEVESAPSTIACLKSDGLRVVRATVEISLSGRAPKSDAALFVLALAASPSFANAETVAAALNALPQVARTGQQLCTFAAFTENLRGWGRGLRSAIAEWYLNQPLPSWLTGCCNRWITAPGRTAICCVSRIPRQRRRSTMLFFNGPWMASLGIWQRLKFSRAICARCGPTNLPSDRRARASLCNSSRKIG